MGSYLDGSRYERVLEVTRDIEDREPMFERRWARSGALFV
jgi:hypothetical protein